ncbi:hypothetical protein EMGBD4_13550 [Verrucomicrobiota bacterium]|nr:hypothetical protein EMGBD4_13550 [Verrucomicrobiota bacterium]
MPSAPKARRPFLREETGLVSFENTKTTGLFDQRMGFTTGQAYEVDVHVC